MNGTKKGIALLLLVAAVAAIVLFVRSGISVADAIRYARTMRGNWWTAVAYIAVYAALNVLFIPTTLLSVASAVIWGWLLGGTIELLAATVGAMLPYALARWLGPDWTPSFSRSPFARLHSPDSDKFTVLLILRLVPVIPYTALNYAAGLTRISAGQYALATFVGIIPSTFVFAFFVDSIAAGVLQPHQVFLRILVAGGVLAAVVLVTRLFASRLRSDRIAAPGHTAPPPAGEDRAAE